MKEFELRIPVANWLLSRGLSPIVEVASLHNCDLVGLRVEMRPMRVVEMVAVELKLTDVAKVLRQCSSHRENANEVWAAMPADVAVRNIVRFSEKGVGLLAVDGNEVRPIFSPPVIAEPPSKRWNNYAGLMRRRNEYLWRMKNPMMLRETGEEKADRLERQAMYQRLRAS